MNKFWIISFNEQMEIKVYKYWDYSHDNIGNEIVDKSGFVSMESSFKKSSRLVYT